MRWSLIFAIIGVVLLSQPGIAKIEHFTDKEGTLHISNESQAEPEKPGGIQAPAPIETPPQQMCPPGIPQTPGRLPGMPPEGPRDPTGNEAKPPAPETGGEAQPAPAVPPTQVAPGQED